MSKLYDVWECRAASGRKSYKCTVATNADPGDETPPDRAVARLGRVRAANTKQAVMLAREARRP